MVNQGTTFHNLENLLGESYLQTGEPCRQLQRIQRATFVRESELASELLGNHCSMRSNFCVIVFCVQFNNNSSKLVLCVPEFFLYNAWRLYEQEKDSDTFS